MTLPPPYVLILIAAGLQCLAVVGSAFVLAGVNRLRRQVLLGGLNEAQRQEVRRICDRGLSIYDTGAGHYARRHQGDLAALDPDGRRPLHDG